MLKLPSVLAIVSSLLSSLFGPRLEIVRDRVTGRESGAGIVPSGFVAWEVDAGGVVALGRPVLLVLAWGQCGFSDGVELKWTGWVKKQLRRAEQRARVRHEDV
jgi:hypothetical protein